MNRVTEKELRTICDRINRITNSPLATYGENGSNVGNYCLDHAYGGVALHRIANTDGGCEDVLRCGHVPKRELARLMYAFVLGIEAGEEVAA